MGIGKLTPKEVNDKKVVEQFGDILGKSESKKLDAEMKINLVKIIDDYRLNKGKDLELQQDAAKIAEDLSIPMPKNYGALVEKLQKVLDSQN